MFWCKKKNLDVALDELLDKINGLAFVNSRNNTCGKWFIIVRKITYFSTEI